jgi:pilus assembly protein CpaB
VASIGISEVIKRDGRSGELAMGEIFVAVADVDIGAKLDATKVKLDKWPKDRIPEGAISKLEDLNDKFPRVRLFTGEPILRAKLMDSKDGKENSAKIPEGYRVVSVKVTMDEVVSGLVQPGDRVDVVVFLKGNNTEINKTMANTILKDVRVFAINSETERSTNKDGEQTVAKTVSLLVKPNQVESIMLAGELGKLRLSLRRPNDPTLHEDDDGTDIEEMLTKIDRGPTEKPQTTAIGKPSDNLLNLLNQPQQAPLPQPTEQASAGWTMTVLGPAGTSQFQWRNPNELPQMISTTDAGPATALPGAIPGPTFGPGGDHASPSAGIPSPSPAPVQDPPDGAGT